MVLKIQGLIISALLFAVVTAIFAVINVDPVKVNFLFATTETPLILAILIAALLGGLTVGLFGFIRQFRQQRHIRQLEKQLEALKNVAAEAEIRSTAPAPFTPVLEAQKNEGSSDPGLV
jgi:uncharacterized integral membrane protein